MRVAAIGIGSNSLRMLVADVDGGRLLRLDRYREGLRVFAALDRQGNIMADMIGKACQSVEAFRRQAAAQGAEQIPGLPPAPCATRQIRRLFPRRCWKRPAFRWKSAAVLWRQSFPFSALRMESLPG